MKSEISKGIMVEQEYDDFVMYRTMCDCGENDHDVSISFGYDESINMIELYFYKELYYSSHWGSSRWYGKLWKKIKGATKLLFTGYIEVEESFLIRDLDQIDNIITAFIEGRRKIATKQEKVKQRKVEEK